MAESIFERVRRVLSANVEDAADQLERAGGTRVMREVVREVDRAADAVRDRLDAAAARRHLATRRARIAAERIEQMESKARFAMAEDREDLAEAAVSRVVDFEAEITRARKEEATAAQEEAKLAEALSMLESRHEEMAAEVKLYEQAEREERLVKGEGVVAEDAVERTRRRLERAEKTFARVKDACGTAPVVDVEALSGLAELDALERKARVSERLEALKRPA